MKGKECWTTTNERFRRALEHALQHTDEHATVDALLGALATVIDDHDGANAFEMAQTGILALVHRLPAMQEEVRVWHAISVGCDPSQDAIGILDLAAAVDRTIFQYRASEQLLSPAGAAAVAAFREEYLVEHFGDGVPSEEALLEWFSMHGKSRSNGGLTTVGLVARIVHAARLFGAPGGDLEKTLKRVSADLARARKLTKSKAKPFTLRNV